MRSADGTNLICQAPSLRAPSCEPYFRKVASTGFDASCAPTRPGLRSLWNQNRFCPILPNFVSFRARQLCAPGSWTKPFSQARIAAIKERHETPLKIASSPKTGSRPAARRPRARQHKPQQRSPHATGASKITKNVRHEVRRRPRRVREGPDPGRQQRLPREDDLRSLGTRENCIANG